MTGSSDSGSQQVGGLLRQWQNGRKTAADEFFTTLYPELRRLAAARLRREREGHSWQPTLLVNELYLELLKNKALDSSFSGEAERQAFLGLAGFLMKRLLILHSRPLRQRVTERPEAELLDQACQQPAVDHLRFIDQLLDQLGSVDAKLRTVVELKVFEGQSHEEIAKQMQCSVRSVGSYWSFARQWLEEHLSERPLEQ
jgi:RNA polymerase sigma factor (TIGR02999 family)